MTDHHNHSESDSVYGIMAEFETSEEVVAAAQAAYAQGYRSMDAYSPHPIDGLAEAIGFNKNRVALVVLLGGLTGGISGFLLQWFTAAVVYPFDVGGRPYFSWPAFIPITFEMTVLFAAISGVIGMLVLNGLPQPYHPAFNAPSFALASTDRFFLCIQADDPNFDAEAVREFLTQFEPKSLAVVPL